MGRELGGESGRVRRRPCAGKDDNYEGAGKGAAGDEEMDDAHLEPLETEEERLARKRRCVPRPTTRCLRPMHAPPTAAARAGA